MLPDKPPWAAASECPVYPASGAGALARGVQAVCSSVLCEEANPAYVMQSPATVSQETRGGEQRFPADCPRAQGSASCVTAVPHSVPQTQSPPRRLLMPSWRLSGCAACANRSRARRGGRCRSDTRSGSGPRTPHRDPRPGGPRDARAGPCPGRVRVRGASGGAWRSAAARPGSREGLRGRRAGTGRVKHPSAAGLGLPLLPARRWRGGACGPRSSRRPVPTRPIRSGRRGTALTSARSSAAGTAGAAPTARTGRRPP